MSNKFTEGQITLTTKSGTYSAGFIEQAIAFALANGLTDQQNENNPSEFSVTIHTPVGPIISRPTDVQAFPGFCIDWEVDGEYIPLSTSEYQIEAGVFATHVYADFGDDSPTRSTKHYFDVEIKSDVKSVMRLLQIEN